jgi:hypothetical protein
MATAPRCKLCGVAHWPSHPHTFKDEPATNMIANRRGREAYDEYERDYLWKRRKAG